MKIIILKIYYKQNIFLSEYDFSKHNNLSLMIYLLFLIINKNNKK